ncbi:MAG: hypothetical protein ACTHOF_09990 [Flavisolibacter sp.]
MLYLYNYTVCLILQGFTIGRGARFAACSYLLRVSFATQGAQYTVHAQLLRAWYEEDAEKTGLCYRVFCTEKALVFSA